MDFITQVLALFGGGVVIVGLIFGGAWWAFQTFGQQWLQSRFNSQLEAMKHDQAQEMDGSVSALAG
tara:strand:+ start:6186 stop:6383 length:198 start_codon:yes stop_codon:yes gene_type:complete